MFGSDTSRYNLEISQHPFPAQIAIFIPLTLSTTWARHQFIFSRLYTSTMTSHLATTCCYHGFKHGGQPRGTMSMLDDIEIYTSHPPKESTEYGLLM